MHKKGKKKSFSVNLFSFLFPSLYAKVRVCQLGFILSVQSIVSKVLLKIKTFMFRFFVTFEIA